MAFFLSLCESILSITMPVWSLKLWIELLQNDLTCWSSPALRSSSVHSWFIACFIFIFLNLTSGLHINPHKQSCTSKFPSNVFHDEEKVKAFLTKLPCFKDGCKWRLVNNNWRRKLGWKNWMAIFLCHKKLGMENLCELNSFRNLSFNNHFFLFHLFYSGLTKFPLLQIQVWLYN